MGDYDAQVPETNMASFCKTSEWKSLLNEPTCYKNPLNPSCIDQFLSNNTNSFQKTFVMETELSDFNKLKLQWWSLTSQNKNLMMRDYHTKNKEMFVFSYLKG